MITCSFLYFLHLKVFTHKKAKFFSASKYRQYHPPEISSFSLSSGAGSHLILSCCPLKTTKARKLILSVRKTHDDSFWIRAK